MYYEVVYREQRVIPKEKTISIEQRAWVKIQQEYHQHVSVFRTPLFHDNLPANNTDKLTSNELWIFSQFHSQRGMIKSFLNFFFFLYLFQNSARFKSNIILPIYNNFFNTSQRITSTIICQQYHSKCSIFSISKDRQSRINPSILRQC